MVTGQAGVGQGNAAAQRRRAERLSCTQRVENGVGGPSEPRGCLKRKRLQDPLLTASCRESARVEGICVLAGKTPERIWRRRAS